MLYRTREGDLFGGIDARQAVIALRSVSRYPGDSLVMFMAELAGRAELQTGHQVRWSVSEDFLADLASAGLIELVT
jgi:hypothetical protein